MWWIRLGERLGLVATTPTLAPGSLNMGALDQIRAIVREELARR
jgi:hypothetical protein